MFSDSFELEGGEHDLSNRMALWVIAVPRYVSRWLDTHCSARLMYVSSAGTGQTLRVLGTQMVTTRQSPNRG